jgi:hypothetical protein
LREILRDGARGVPEPTLSGAPERCFSSVHRAVAARSAMVRTRSPAASPEARALSFWR